MKLKKEINYVIDNIVIDHDGKNIIHDLESFISNGRIVLTEQNKSDLGLLGDIRVINTNSKRSTVFSDGLNVDLVNFKNTKYRDMGLEPEIQLNLVHENIIMKYGSLDEEVPEQMMAATYMDTNAIVLELGANVGRNSVVISCLLDDSSKLVAVECDPRSYTKLKENRDLNYLNFLIEESALSSQRLQQIGWDTIPINEEEGLKEGYKEVNTITLAMLRSKYNLKFNTLVIDCEGAFYYILKDNPNVLAGIHTVIMENDYKSLDQYNFVQKSLKERDLVSIYRKAGGFGPCKDYFFEVFKVF